MPELKRFVSTRLRGGNSLAFMKNSGVVQIDYPSKQTPPIVLSQVALVDNFAHACFDVTLELLNEF